MARLLNTLRRLPRPRRRIGLVVAAPLVAALASVQAIACRQAGEEGIERGDRLVLESDVLRVAFSRASGELLAIDNLAADLALLPPEGSLSGPPRVGLVGQAAPRPQGFRYTLLEDTPERQSLSLVWDYTDGVRVEVRAELAEGGALVKLWPRVVNEGTRGVRRLDYPTLRRLNTLGETAKDDVLVHPFVRGMLVRNPVSTLDIAHNPMAEALYPQAYNGMTHQLVDYYSQGTGGFFFAAFDPHATEKALTMPLAGGSLGLGWSAFSWDERPGESLELDYPIVIGANTTGDWYEAADHYRNWAVTAPWCAERGPRAARPEGERARWLFEDVGLATFGTSAAVDQSAWYRAYGELVDAVVLHVAGFDALGEQGRGDDPEDVEFAIDPRNASAIEGGGDEFAIFLADLRTSFLPREMAHEVGRQIVGVVLRETPEACPKNELWQHLHAHRAVRALADTGAASFYCDASAPNRELGCMSREHGHPPGRGRWMNEGYRELYAGTQRALTDSCGRYVPIGVELMHEGLLDRFDYYQARNGAGFMGGLEGGFYRGLQLKGLVETVPVFSYLYHDYAPVTLDGCGKVSERIGDLFYWMAARVVLAGGIFELNNEFAPAERFPGTTRVGMLHYKARDAFEWLEEGEDGNEAYDPAKGAFLRDLAAARTEFGTDFLAYGRMLPPPALPFGRVSLDYSYYNNIDWGGKPNSTRFSSAQGSHLVPRVLCHAWQAGGRLGVFFVNLDEETAELEVDLDLGRYAAYGLEFESEVRGTLRGALGSAPIDVRSGEPVRLRLPARRVVLLELPSGG